MIGDLVYARINHPVQVVGVTTDSIETTNKEGFYYEESFEPIPLTPEILEKNGFKRIKRPVFADAFVISESMYWCNYALFSCDDGNYFGDTARIICYCYSVHELQHALKLCGIDKEIVL